MAHTELLDRAYRAYLTNQGAEGYFEQNHVVMRELIRYTTKCIGEWETGGLERLDKLLDHADPNRLHELNMIALIRCNYRVRNAIMNWHTFTKDAKAVMEARGLHTQSLLYGIEVEEKA